MTPLDCRHWLAEGGSFLFIYLLGNFSTLERHPNYTVTCASGAEPEPIGCNQQICRASSAAGAQHSDRTQNRLSSALFHWHFDIRYYVFFFGCVVLFIWYILCELFNRCMTSLLSRPRQLHFPTVPHSTNSPFWGSQPFQKAHIIPKAL